MTVRAEGRGGKDGGRAPGAGSDPFRWRAMGAGAMVALMIPCLLVLMVASLPRPVAHPLAEVAAALGVEPVRIMVGESVYKNNCALCHGQTGEGIPRLGKPMRNSAFVRGHTDEDLFHLIASGRMPTDPENTTGALMPARGGNTGLSDEALRDVVVYLRTLQEPGADAVSLEAWIVASGGESASTGGSVMAGIGHDAFVASCSACHGVSGQGLPGLGLPLRDSPFVETKTDKELMTFIKMGRPVWDPDNQTGLDMPPKGGNPALNDEQIAEIIAYLRLIHAPPGE